jgi:hypothetical protein
VCVELALLGPAFRGAKPPPLQACEKHSNGGDGVSFHGVKTSPRQPDVIRNATQ